MDDETRHQLAAEFAGVIEEVRESKWEPFSQAAAECETPPYEMLARLLVRVVESTLEE